MMKLGSLDAAIIAIAEESQLKFITRTPWHWQLADNRYILCDMWPTKFKIRPQFNEIVTTEYFSQQTFISAVKVVCQQYKDYRNNKKQAPAVPDDFPENEKQGYGGKRYNTADIVLDDNELRLIIGGSDFVTSVRLTADETLEYLVKAKQLWRQLNAHENTRRLDCRSDCRV